MAFTMEDSRNDWRARAEIAEEALAKLKAALMVEIEISKVLDKTIEIAEIEISKVLDKTIEIAEKLIKELS